MSSSSSSTAINNNDRCYQFINDIPFITRCLIIINISLFIYEYIGVKDSIEVIMDSCINYYYIIYKNEYYRLILSAFIHNGILHIFFNMMSLYYCGIFVEKLIGSTAYLGLNILFPLLNNSILLIISYIMLSVPTLVIYTFSCSVGFSGVLFAFVVIESKYGASESRNLCGINIPALLYPWVLLIGISLIMSNVSFIGHLSGLLSGLIYISGGISWITPTNNMISKFENYLPLDYLRSYVRVPERDVIPSYCFNIWTLCSNGCPRINLNIQLPSLPNLSSSDSNSVRYDPVINDIELGESSRHPPLGSSNSTHSTSDNRHLNRLLPKMDSAPAGEPKLATGTLSSSSKDIIASS